MTDEQIDAMLEHVAIQADMFFADLVVPPVRAIVRSHLAPHFAKYEALRVAAIELQDELMSNDFSDAGLYKLELQNAVLGNALAALEGVKG